MISNLYYYTGYFKYEKEDVEEALKIAGEVKEFVRDDD